jgi:DNA-binding transcriptional MerR regulator
MERFLTPADVARRLGITPAAVRAMERRGTLRAVARTERGARLFKATDVTALARKRAHLDLEVRHD